MKFALKLTCLFLFTSIATNAQNEVITIENKGKKIPARVILPEGYSEDRDYPVLIGPGLDNGNLDMGCRYFGPSPESNGWILVESSIHMENRSAVALLLDVIESKYSSGSIFILGFSANSIDAFDIARTYKDRIDGIVGMPGNPNPANIKEHKDQQILMIVGERDTYWKKRAEKAKVLLDNKKYKNELVIIPNGGHILDELAGKRLFSILNEKLFTGNKGK